MAAERVVQEPARADHLAPADRIQHHLHPLRPSPPQHLHRAGPVGGIAKRMLDERRKHAAGELAPGDDAERPPLDRGHARGQLDERLRVLQRFAPGARRERPAQSRAELADVRLLLLDEPKPSLAGLPPVCGSGGAPAR